jgi:hypothetical protein
LIQSSTNFRRFDSSGIDDEPHRRLADRVYGLSEWAADKTRRGSHEVEQRVHVIPVRQRDTRMVGCTGDSQVVISNADLEDLIVSVLDAVDSPVDVRTLRSLVMSRLPVMDIYLVPSMATTTTPTTRTITSRSIGVRILRRACCGANQSARQPVLWMSF